MEEKFHIISKYDDRKIHGTIFIPEQKQVKGIVQISHGMCEHKERYFDFMRFLNNNGYITVINDHRGHGESVTNKQELGYFKDKQGDAIVDDLLQVTLYIKNRYPQYKVILFGHSMGSLVVRKYIQENDDKISKLIVCGSPSKNNFVSIGICITKIIGMFKGEFYRSKFVEHMATGRGNKKFLDEKDEVSWITSDKKIRDNYRNDELCNFKFTINGYLNLFYLVKHVYTKNRYKVLNRKLPILFIAGEDDPVIVSKEKWNQSQEFLRKVGYSNVKGILYNKMRHEILNEIEKDKVYNDILKYISD